MGDLPWLVENGAAVWPTLVALAAGAGVWWAVRALPGARRRARAARRTAAPVRVSCATATLGERIALGGRLRVEVPVAEGGPFVRFGAVVAATFEADDAHARPAKGSGVTDAGTLALETDDGTRVPLLGAVEVEVGSTETRSALARRAIELKVGGVLRASAMPEPSRARALREGDRVLATGVVTSVPRGTGTTAYRAEAHGKALGATDDAPISLLFEGTPRGTGPLGASGKGLVAHALGGVVVALVLLHTVGTATTRIGTRRALGVASATPFHRARALATLRARIDLAEDPTPSRVREAAGLEALLGHCDVAGALLVRHHLPFDAFETMQRCPDDHALFGAWLELGDVGTASRWARREPAASAPVDPWLLASVHLAAQDGPRASAALRALAATAPRELAPELDCLASAASRFGGVGSKPMPSPLYCPLEAADAQQVSPETDRRYSVLGEGPWDPVATAYVMSVERRGGDVRYRSERDLAGSQVFVNARRAVTRIPPALLTSALRAIEDKPGRRAAALRGSFQLRLALVDAYFGELDAARRRSDEVLRECAFREPYAKPMVTDPFDDRVGAHAERIPEASELPDTLDDDEKEAVRDAFRLADEARVLQIALRVRDGLPIGKLERAPRSAHLGLLLALHDWKTRGDAGSFLLVRAKLPQHERLWAHVAHNDPFGLVGELEREGTRGREVVDFLGGERGAHEAVARWLRTTYPSVTSSDVHTLQDVAEHLAARHVTARTVRAVDVVEPTFDALRGLRRSFEVRETAILLAHLDQLRHRAGRI